MDKTNAAESAASAAAPSPQLALRKGIVKMVLSGDSVIIRAQPKGGPPPEKTVVFSSVTAPKLARRPGAGDGETRDEPWAWESREFLRDLLIGKEVFFHCEKPPNSSREYGVVYLSKEPRPETNVTELIVTEGLVTVRRDSRQTPELTRLIALEDAARAAGKGKWGSAAPEEHVRDIKWSVADPREFLESQRGKSIRAVVEHVRDGSTLRAFLLPDFHYITLMISGIRCPGFKLDADGKPDPTVNVPYALEARFFVESRLLQREVEILLESVNNSNFVGTVLCSRGNIAEALLREGFAKCVDWSMAFMGSGADKLRAAEKHAKENRLRLWENYQSSAPKFEGKDKDFTGTVTEIYNGDAIAVRGPNGTVKKVWLSSIRPPREQARATTTDGDGEPAKPEPRPKNFRPLYDIPWMFETREFLRKKLIGKKVHCTLDFIVPAKDALPERYCYTVTIGGANVAEKLVSNGLATVLRYRQDDDQRSSRYDELLAAEAAAVKATKGLHSRKDTPTLRLIDLTIDSSRIKHQYLPSWQRALRIDAIVEYVASGSRLRIYIPKEMCLVTFLLSGISCPRSSRPASGNQPAAEGDPFGDEALRFTRERILHRDVSVQMEGTDKAGSAVIGWLWLDKVNLSVALVEEGLASVHSSAEKSEHFRVLKAAEDRAKAAKKNIWANWEEKTETEKPEDGVEAEKDEEPVAEKTRKVEPVEVFVIDVTSELHFWVQKASEGPQLETLMQKLRSEFQSRPPVAGSFNPKRGEICAAKFSEDNEWYRAKIERLQGQNATVLYIDYGNREQVPRASLAALPHEFRSDQAYAREYVLACTKMPPDEDDRLEAIKALREDAMNAKRELRHMFTREGVPYATLTDPKTKLDIGKTLIADGFLLVDVIKTRAAFDLVKEYRDAEASARKQRVGIWKYGDITEDNATEFGITNRA